MTVCTKCGVDKPEDEFSWKSQPKGIKHSHCKPCHRVIRQKHYQNTAAKTRTDTKAYRKEIKSWMAEYKTSLSCSECGFSHPAALDFHHTNPAEKEADPGAMTALGWAKSRIMKELDKCIVLCANCHRIHHYNERQDTMRDLQSGDCTRLPP